LDLESQFLNLYRALVADPGLRGVFNIDFVLSGGRPIPLEVNPRYSASIEVLEHGIGRPVFAERYPPNPPPPCPKREGGEGPLLAPPSLLGKGGGGLGSAVGKAIYYAPH